MSTHITRTAKKVMDNTSGIGYVPPRVGMWPSLVGHCVRDAGVARSNRAIPTISCLYSLWKTNGSSLLHSRRYLLSYHPPTTDAI
jgi:hypothetical protein